MMICFQVRFGVPLMGPGLDLFPLTPSGPARATAITAKWGQRELRISLPVPTIDPSLDILSITLSPSPTAPFVEIAWKVSGEMDDETRGRIQRGVDAAKGAGVDAVEIVKRVIDACLE